MIKKNIIYMLLLITIITIFFLFAHNERKNTYESISHFDYSEDSISSCMVNFEMNNLLTGSSFPISSLNLDTVLLKKRAPILVLRISEQQCDMCIDHEMFILQSIMPGMRDKIVVLGTYSIVEYYKWRIITDTYFPVQLDCISLKTESYMKPYFFLLDSNLKISNIFIPNTKFSKLTINYLKGIKKILSE